MYISFDSLWMRITVKVPLHVTAKSISQESVQFLYKGPNMKLAKDAIISKSRLVVNIPQFFLALY